VIHSNGTQFWYKHGEQHRNDDKPALIWADGSQWWYKHGEQHRDNDKPAVIDHDGSTCCDS